MSRAEQPSAVSAPFHETLSFSALSRFLTIETDHPEVAHYVRNAFARALVNVPAEAPGCHRGSILCAGSSPYVTFNNERVEFLNDQPLTTPFRAAFYGSSKLFRLCFLSDPDWVSLYGSAVSVGERGILISARSGTGKTTLTLELIAREAHFFSDEYVFIRKSDKYLSGLVRTLMLRERTLSLLSDRRVRAACAELSPRRPLRSQRIWDFLDVGAIFGESVLASPVPLSLVILLERSDIGFVGSERIPISVAAAALLPRINKPGGTAFGRLTETASLLEGIPCYRVTMGSPGRTADAIMTLLAQ